MIEWLGGVFIGLLAGMAIGGRCARRRVPRGAQLKVRAVIAAFSQLDRSRQGPRVVKMKGLATGKTYRVPMSLDWDRFVRAVNDLALTLDGGPLRASLGGQDPEVDFKPEKRGI